MRSKNLRILFSLAIAILFSVEAYSRAGGAGGASGSGSSGSGGLLKWLFLLPWPVQIIIILIVAGAFIFVYLRKGSAGVSNLENILTGETDGGLVSANSGGPSGTPQPISAEFIAANPDFNQQAFLAKVSTAFMGIQDAWQNKNLSKVRKWITDGVYQRYNAQFTMMNMLEQTNILSNINIKQVRIESATQEGSYSLITASVYFSMDDNFICKKHPEFNEKFSGDTATEYWTFLKKSGVAEKDLYHSNNCPKCGSELGNDGGQISKCPSCGTVTYLGDYDWVLCEVTQEDDYNRGAYRIDKNDPSLATLYASEDFCIQLMEDRASNAMMQYFVSKTTHDLKYVKRFTSDELYTRIEEQLKNEEKFIFNRLYLNAVDMISCVNVSNVYWATFTIFYSSMRLREEANGALSKLDDTVVERTLQLTLAKKAGATQKTKLWSFACPSCGAPYTDTTATKCNYCDAKINSTDNDWVILNLTETN